MPRLKTHVAKPFCAPSWPDSPAGLAARRTRLAPAWIAWGAATACVLVGCREANQYQPPDPPTVSVSRPLRTTVTDYLEETGTTEAVERVEVRARVTGFLEEKRFEAGQDVEQGDVLYVIEPRPFQAQVDAAKAQLAAAQVEFARADADFKREDSLLARNATSESDWLAAKTDRDATDAAIQAATAVLDRAQLDLEYTQVTAPISGRVGKTLVKVGNLVDGNAATQLTTVVKYDPIWANFNISERDLLKLRGQRDASPDEDDERSITDVDAFLSRATDTGYPFRGNLDYADLAVDQSTGTFMIRARFDNPNFDIVPGLFVQVRIPIGQQPDAMLVPQVAVGADQAGKYLLVVNGQNEVERRNVTVGANHGQMVVVAEGLLPEDKVITSGIQRARPGVSVVPDEKPLTLEASGIEATPQPPASSPEPPPAASQSPAAADAQAGA